MNESAEKLLALARDHADAGRGGPAAEALSSATAMAPDDPVVLERAADLLAVLGLTGQAEQTFLRALALEPDRAGALFGLARLRVALGQPGDSLDLIERGCRAHPGDPRGPHMLGRMYLEQGLLAAAIRALAVGAAISGSGGDGDVAFGSVGANRRLGGLDVQAGGGTITLGGSQILIAEGGRRGLLSGQGRPERSTTARARASSRGA